MSFQHPQELKKLLESILVEIFGLISSDVNVKACEESNNYDTLLNYTCMGGKMIRGMEAIISAKAACEHFQTRFVIKEAAVIGACVEVLEGAFLVADDIMDDASRRRNKLSWHKVNGVGLNGINDSFILLNLRVKILTYYFHSHPNFTHMLVFFEDMVGKTSLGQKIDVDYSFQRKFATSYQASSLKSLFSLERHKKICEYKTSYYTFFLPIGLGILYGIPPQELLTSYPVVPVDNFFSSSTFALSLNHSLFCDIKDVCVDFGVLFQSQDDFIDVFSDSKNAGKVGTDIADGKLSFLLVLALSHENTTIREKAEQIVMEHYGVKEQIDVDSVKDFYKAIKLEIEFKKQEERMVNSIKEKIGLYSGKHKFFPTKMLLELLESLVDRNK